MDSFAVDDDDEDEVNPGDELEEATAVTAETTADDSCQCQCDAGVRGGVGGGGATKDELSDEGCYFVSLASSPVQATQVSSLTQFPPIFALLKTDIIVHEPSRGGLLFFFRTGCNLWRCIDFIHH